MSTNHIQVTVSPIGVRPGEVIVRHPRHPEQEGEWTVLAKPTYDGWYHTIPCRDADGREGKFDLGPGMQVTLSVPVPTIASVAEVDGLSRHDQAWIAAWLHENEPEVFDRAVASIARLPQYRTVLQEVA